MRPLILYLDIIIHRYNNLILGKRKPVSGSGELDGVLCFEDLVEFLELSNVSFCSERVREE